MIPLLTTLSLLTLGACGGAVDSVQPGPLEGEGGTACANDSDCDGDLCLGGRCCAEASVCGDVCCGGGQVCFANACVTPGATCYSAGDCKEGEYCEPSLGPADAPPPSQPPGGDAQVCVHAPPTLGACLALPARCDPGAPPTDDCLPACEVRPEGGKLTAAAEWRWDPSTVKQYKAHVDVWATPAVGRVTDSNCDGKINELDPPNVVFVSGDAKGTCCSCGGNTNSCKNGVLRVLDGATGVEIWSLRKASDTSIGFAGLSVAIGDADGDGAVEIVAMTGEGRLALIDATGKVLRVSKEQVAGFDAKSFGWGGGLALADMDGDGRVEVAYGGTVFSITPSGIELRFTQPGGYLSTFVDLDGAPDGQLELLVGGAAYRANGASLWATELPRSNATHPGVGDFDGDGKPEVVLVNKGKLYVVAGATGKTLLGPLTLPGTGNGGPPTVADFDGDGRPEIGVAMAEFYAAIKPDLTASKLKLMWKAPNHDLSSSVTGSTVFDFEGDGAAEVIYNDECFLWVYDGKTGAVRFATPTTSFTATESSLVADVDGDGRAEMVMIANGADPGADGWKCDVAPWNKADAALGRPAWKAPNKDQPAYRGLTLWGDKLDRWVGTRTLWNQHTYHVSNICDHRDDACGPGATYGAIPRRERGNWTVPWLNNFRQNVQDKGLFDAPDAAVTVRVACSSPVVVTATVRNLGLTLLPAGVEVRFFVVAADGSERLLGKKVTAGPLFPGQAAELRYTAKDGDNVDPQGTFVARILNDPDKPSFIECRADNNASAPRQAACLK